MIAAIWLTACMAMNGSSLAVLGILLPTLIHVSLFTLVFMVLGAFRSGSKMQAVLVAALSDGHRVILRAAAVRRDPVPAFAKAAQEYFANVAPALGRLFGIPDLTLDNRLDEPARLRLHLSLPELVHQSGGDPLDRYFENAAGADRRGSAASTALYFYDYAFGFTVLLALAWRMSCWNSRSTGLALRQLGAAIGRARRDRRCTQRA